ncbi:MAG: EamA family transporter, partial [Hydrotalea flava]|nr:EamA family transporter [Hydrotalea flava]NIT19363.1 EamA family transporter [Hydrotalea flava]
MQKFSIKTYIFIFLVALFWASAFVAIRVGLKSYSPDTLALLRYLVASIVMIPLYLKSRSVNECLTRNEFIRIILVGVIGIGVYNIALNYGEITVSSAIASFIVSQVPVFIVLLAVIFLKERV